MQEVRGSSPLSSTHKCLAGKELQPLFIITFINPNFFVFKCHQCTPAKAFQLIVKRSSLTLGERLHQSYKRSLALTV